MVAANHHAAMKEESAWSSQMEMDKSFVSFIYISVSNDDFVLFFCAYLVSFFLLSNEFLRAT